MFVDQFAIEIDGGELIRAAHRIDGQQFHQRLLGEAKIVLRADEGRFRIGKFHLGAQDVEARDGSDVEPRLRVLELLARVA